MSESCARFFPAGTVLRSIPCRTDHQSRSGIGATQVLCSSRGVIIRAEEDPGSSRCTVGCDDQSSSFPTGGPLSSSLGHRQRNYSAAVFPRSGLAASYFPHDADARSIVTCGSKRKGRRGRRAERGQGGNSNAEAWEDASDKAPSGVQGSSVWVVPWGADTVIQIMLLWFFAFWFIGSWLVPMAAHAAGIDRLSLSARGQALYSLVTDVAEMSVGLAILDRCLRRFSIPRSWFRINLSRGWYVDALLACVFFPLVRLLSRLNLQLLPVSIKFHPANQIEHSISAKDPLACAIYALVVGLCAPVWEEIIFRGFLLPSLTRYVPVWGAVVGSAVIFALAHFSMQRMLPLFFLGVVIGIVYVRNRNLATSMLLHSLWNGFVFMDFI